MTKPYVKLIRLETSEEDGTFGAIFVNDKLVCWTLEPPMNNNKSNISCIVAKTYRVVKDRIGRHKFWKVLDVFGRTNIEFHLGNIWSKEVSRTDTMGCILLGSQIVDNVLGKRGLVDSKDAMNLFQAYLGDAKEFELVIENRL